MASRGSIPNNHDRYFFLHTIYLFISCNKLHTVCINCIQVLPLLVPGRQVCTICVCVLLQLTLTEPRHKNRLLHLKNQIKIFIEKKKQLAKKSNILLGKALIRLRRYLGMLSQLTVRAICSFFLDLAQQKHG